MPADDRNSDELDRAAADAGLDLVLSGHRPALAKALASARRLKADLPREFGMAEEPAHVFRLAPEEPRR